MKKNTLMALIALAAFAMTAAAAPAPWYWWKSTLDGKRVCQQVLNGEGWVKDSGPYKDSRCTIPGNPGE